MKVPYVSPDIKPTFRIFLPFQTEKFSFCVQIILKYKLQTIVIPLYIFQEILQLFLLMNFIIRFIVSLNLFSSLSSRFTNHSPVADNYALCICKKWSDYFSADILLSLPPAHRLLHSAVFCRKDAANLSYLLILP